MTPEMPPLRVLLVEDDPNDAELVLRALRRDLGRIESRRVEDAAGLAAALEEAWDVVVSDYSLPTFDARAALRMVQARGLDLPFLIVSGTVGEETAVAAMKAGAHDYLVKGKLARLGAAVERELREAENRAERRRAEQRLEAVQAWYGALVQRLPDPVFALTDGTTTFANGAALAALGAASTEDVVGRPFEALIHPEDRGAARTLVVDLLRGEARPVELRLLRSDGGVRLLVVQGQELATESGIVLVAQDVTEHRAAQEQLMIADRMAAVGLLAAGVAHEINNPLAAVLGNVEYALEALPAAPPDVVAALRDAREAGDAARRIVADVKMFSRGDDGAPVDAVDVRAVLDSALRMAWNELRHRARVRREYDDVPPVLGQDGRLGQVFLNLLVNAAYAMPDGSADRHEIRLVTRVDGTSVVIEVVDTGAGIPPDVLRRLFTPFVTTKPKAIGTGLGLSICRRIVTDLGGTITLDSTVGLGTTARVSLPAAPGARRADPVPAEPSRPGRRSVLVVDDQELVARALERCLVRQHTVEVVLDARVAIARIREGRRYDAILCDLMMPNVSGSEFYRELAVVAPEQAERVVFMTGGAFTPAARAFLDTVPNAWLDKPFDAAHLAAAVAGELRRPA